MNFVGDIMTTLKNYDLQILNHIGENPDTTQADLAAQLGVAVGSVNWYVKRLINKGHIKGVHSHFYAKKMCLKRLTK